MNLKNGFKRIQSAGSRSPRLMSRSFAARGAHVGSYLASKSVGLVLVGVLCRRWLPERFPIFLTGRGGAGESVWDTDPRLAVCLVVGLGVLAFISAVRIWLHRTGNEHVPEFAPMIAFLAGAYAASYVLGIALILMTGWPYWVASTFVLFMAVAAGFEMRARAHRALNAPDDLAPTHR